MEVVKYVLKDNYFEKFSTFGKPNFVFFDFLGLTAFAYSKNVAWILNIAATAAVFVAMWKRMGDFGYFGGESTSGEIFIEMFQFHVLEFRNIGSCHSFCIL